jgi:hypothetical protein
MGLLLTSLLEPDAHLRKAQRLLSAGSCDASPVASPVKHTGSDPQDLMKAL